MSLALGDADYCEIEVRFADLGTSKPEKSVVFTRYSKRWGSLTRGGLDVDYSYPADIPVIEVLLSRSSNRLKQLKNSQFDARYAQI